MYISSLKINPPVMHNTAHFPKVESIIPRNKTKISIEARINGN